LGNDPQEKAIMTGLARLRNIRMALDKSIGESRKIFKLGSFVFIFFQSGSEMAANLLKGRKRIRIERRNSGPVQEWRTRYLIIEYRAVNKQGHRPFCAIPDATAVTI
jgi:hypothetical protein